MTYDQWIHADPSRQDANAWEIWNAAQETMIAKVTCDHEWMAGARITMLRKCARPRGHKGPHCNKLYPEDVRA